MIGEHLASLNLFLEPDGSVRITVAGGSAAVADLAQARGFKGRPIDFIERLVVEAAEHFKEPNP